jgi:subtilisin family serine protease
VTKLDKRFLSARTAALFALFSGSLALLASLTREPAASAQSRPPLDRETARVRSHPGGADLLRALGPHARDAFAPASGQVGALVQLPAGTSADALGLDPIAPGIGRLRKSSEGILSFADAHPDLHLEVAPPLHLLIDKAASAVRVSFARLFYKLQGEGMVIGVADTGLDVTHPDFREENNDTRVAWYLDLSLKPIGRHADLEEKFGIKDDKGVLVAGAVLSADDINELLMAHQKTPEDEVGHGTHVASLAAGNGAGSNGQYLGIAPKAKLVIARVTAANGESIENDNLLRGAQFIFDRADAMKLPAVVNLSLGSDFGPHDGSMLWEKTLASYVGPEKPGRILVAAAGNAGSVASPSTHQTVHVTPGSRMRVPIETNGAAKGGVQVWVNLRPKGKMSIGLDAPDETWISPIEEGNRRGKNESNFNAGVIYGSSVDGSPIPAGTRGAVVLWSGAWPKGRYYVTLEGDGLADLYLQATGDAAERPAAFTGGVREGTINLPAAHPSIIAVGCTATRPKWTSVAKQVSGLVVPVLDEAGGLFLGGTRDLEDGEICWFSSAGPNADGIPKPEIAAPGAAIIGAMSQQATPGKPGSIFTTSGCPEKPGTTDRDPRCLQVDKLHGISIGTSMSSPIVAGAVALMLQKDPTLTQDKVTALLQSGAHHIRGAAPYDDQAGPGELDIVGTLYAMEQLEKRSAALPTPDASWITLSEDYVVADGSRSLTAIIELRAATGTTDRPDLFDLARLRPEILLDGHAIPAAELPTVRRHGPGVFSYEYHPPIGKGGSAMTFGATFDGGEIVAPKSIPIAVDPWMARYPVRVGGGCTIGFGPSGNAWVPGSMLAVVFAMRRRRTRSRT